MRTLNDLLTEIPRYQPGGEVDVVRRAYEFTREVHQGQRRVSGEPYDPCYHKACDDITNLSIKALDQMSDGVAHATLTYAEDEEVFVGPSRTETRSSTGVYKEFKGPHARR